MELAPSRFPYTSIGTVETTFTNGDDPYYGTGFLVAPRFIITAAHVLDKKQHVRDRFFTTRTERQRIVAKKIFPGYSQDNTVTDIAVAMLDEPFSSIPLTLMVPDRSTVRTDFAGWFLAGTLVTDSGDKGIVYRSPADGADPWPREGYQAGGPFTFPPATTRHGWSGGPLLSDYSLAVGVISGTLNTTPKKEGVAPLTAETLQMLSNFMVECLNTET